MKMWKETKRTTESDKNRVVLGPFVVGVLLSGAKVPVARAAEGVLSVFTDADSSQYSCVGYCPWQCAHQFPASCREAGWRWV